MDKISIINAKYRLLMNEAERKKLGLISPESITIIIRDPENLIPWGLYLSYPDAREDKTYNTFFDELNGCVEIFENIRYLYFETDFTNSIPNAVMNFKNLKQLEISGSRFWDMDMSQVPSTVEYLRWVELSNISDRFCNGMEKLINLKELYINFLVCNPDGLPHFLRDLAEKVETPLINLPSLQKVVFEIDGGLFPLYDLNYLNPISRRMNNGEEKDLDIIKSDPIFSLISNRILSIVLKCIDGCTHKICVLLNPY